jgi:hypothetical protein
MLFKNSVRTSQRTPHFTITKINWLTLFKEIIAVYRENHTKPQIQNTASLNSKVEGIYSYRLGFKLLNFHNSNCGRGRSVDVYALRCLMRGIRLKKHSGMFTQFDRLIASNSLEFLNAESSFRYRTWYPF